MSQRQCAQPLAFCHAAVNSLVQTYHARDLPTILSMLPYYSETTNLRMFRRWFLNVMEYLQSHLYRSKIFDRIYFNASFHQFPGDLSTDIFLRCFNSVLFGIRIASAIVVKL